MGNSANGDVTMETDEQPVPTEWTEERLEEAQKVLKEMYIRVRELRSTLPRLVAPLATKQPSREFHPRLYPGLDRIDANFITAQKLYHEFSASAETANAEVKQFRQLMEKEQSKEILEHAKESRSQNPKGITPWRITEDPDWMKMDQNTVN